MTEKPEPRVAMPQHDEVDERERAILERARGRYAKHQATPLLEVAR
jgi:hypothetical protein